MSSMKKVRTVVPFVATNDERVHALGAVLYEIQQFCLSWFEVLNPNAVNPARNAFLESMLLHARALTDFFGRGKRPTKDGQELDDVLSVDFGFERSDLKAFSDLRTRINKEVAHISYSRAARKTPKEKAWHLPPFAPLIGICLDFVKSRTDDEIKKCMAYRRKHNAGEIDCSKLSEWLSVLLDGIRRLDVHSK
jgi:hypothetical protein